LNTATQARNAALERVAGAPDVRLMEAALSAVEAVARQQECFTSDAVLDVCPITFAEPRAWGAVMKMAERRGWIEATPDFRQSPKRVCHARPKRVWKSLLFKVL
jgi:hypothetical protein